MKWTYEKQRPIVSNVRPYRVLKCTWGNGRRGEFTIRYHPDERRPLARYWGHGWWVLAWRRLTVAYHRSVR